MQAAWTQVVVREMDKVCQPFDELEVVHAIRKLLDGESASPESVFNESKN